MSNRHNAVQGSNPNPAKIFLQWSSNDQCFTYWDKEAEERKTIPLPFKFLWLDQRSAVRGFHEPSNSNITSNDVLSVAKEKLSVKSYKGGKIAEGFWNEIKQDVTNAGGKFANVVYAMTEKGSLVLITFVGASCGAWMNFTQKTKNRLPDEWVTCYGTQENKKGSNTFYTPEFKFDGQLTQQMAEQADVLFDDVLTPYLKPESNRDVAAAEAEESDDIPF